MKLIFEVVNLYSKNLLSWLFNKKEFLVRGIQVPFFVRPRIYDFGVVAEIFKDEIYLPTFEMPSPKVIVDLGANTGAFTVWAAERFEPSSIICLEPSDANFKMLNLNIELLKKRKPSIQVELRMEAISASESTVRISDSHFLPATTHILNSTSGREVPAIRFDTLMGKIGTVVDYLKIDIEGAEEYLFVPENLEILRKKVRYLNLELHEHGKLDLSYVTNFLNSADFDVKNRNSLKPGIFYIEAINHTLS